MKASANIHATCIRVGRAGKHFGAPAAAGVLLIGRSASGKSDLALRLIGRGALLVADDRVDLVVQRGRLVARAPRSLAGFVEIRGLGIVAMRHAASAGVVLVVNLSDKVRRMPEHRVYTPPGTIGLAAKARPPEITLSAFEDSAPDKVLAAVSALHHDNFRETVKRN